MWHAIYIYIHDVWTQEKLMLALKNLLNASGEPWFFIKYWHGGPHLRVRFKDAGASIKIEEIINHFLAANKMESLNRDAYYQAIHFDGEDIDQDTLPWYEPGTYFYTPYEPETERYGTGRLLSLNEDVFHASSQLAVKAFETIPKFNTRIVFAVYLMKRIMAATIGFDTEYLYRYESYWKTMAGNIKENKHVMHEIIKLVFESESLFIFLEEEIRELIRRIQIIRKESDQFTYMLSSQMHMNNNRISITPAYEYIISKSIGEYLHGKMADTKQQV